jgi:hypothetical protein
MRRITMLAALVVAATCATAQETNAPSAFDLNKAKVRQQYEANRKAFEGNAEVLVQPGVVADRKAKRLLVDVQTTGVEEGKPIEFLAIADNSGHGYESFLVAFAAPSAVHRALEFIGMKPGRPINPARFQFWPRGERVVASMTSGPDAPPEKALRMEKMMVDRATGKALPELGYAFVGSVTVEPERARDGNRYGADVFEPNSIVSIYNEPSTVLDVPKRAAKGDVYEKQVVGRAGVFPADRLCRLVIEPERKDGVVRVMDAVLEVSAAAGVTNVGPESLTMRLTQAGAPVATNTTFRGLVEAVVALNAAGRDVHTEVRFGPEMTIGAARTAAEVLEAFDSEKGIRVEAPPAGEVYYRAFLPDEKLRARENRMEQPWELFLRKSETGVSGQLVKVTEHWNKETMKSTFDSEAFPVADGAALRRTVDEKGSGLPVLLVFAPPSLRYSELMSFVAPMQTTHGRVFVYMER